MGTLKLSWPEVNERALKVVYRSSDFPDFKGIGYYPFGMAMEGSWQNYDGNPEGNEYLPPVPSEKNDNYKFNGLETEDDLTGWVFHKFRVYDPSIGRFMSADPIADQFAHVSPYNFAENEPVNHVDLWGLQAAAANAARDPEAQKFKNELPGKIKNFVRSLFIEGTPSPEDYHNSGDSQPGGIEQTTGNTGKKSEGTGPQNEAENGAETMMTENPLFPGGGNQGGMVKDFEKGVKVLKDDLTRVRNLTKAIDKTRKALKRESVTPGTPGLKNGTDTVVINGVLTVRTTEIYSTTTFTSFYPLPVKKK